MRRRLIPVVVLVAVGALAAGCGGSSKSSAPPAATTAATTAPATTAASSSSAPSTAGLSGDCKKLADLATKFSQAMGAATNPAQGNPSAQVGQVAKLIHEFADAAPGSVKPDLETLASAFDQYASAIKGVNLQSGKVPSSADVAKITKAAQAFSAPKVQAAGRHMQTWITQNCGGLVPTTTG